MFKPTKPQHVTNKNYVDKLAKSLPSELPTEDGTYIPKCVVADGEAAVTWVAENDESEGE